MFWIKQEGDSFTVDSPKALEAVRKQEQYKRIFPPLPRSVNLPVGTLAPWYETKELDIRSRSVWDDELIPEEFEPMSQIAMFSGYALCFGMAAHIVKLTNKYLRTSFLFWNSVRWREPPHEIVGPNATMGPWAKRYGRHYAIAPKTPSWALRRAIARYKFRRHFRRSQVWRIFRKGAKFAVIPFWVAITEYAFSTAFETVEDASMEHIGGKDPVSFFCWSAFTSFTILFFKETLPVRKTIPQKFKQWGYSLLAAGILAYGLRHMQLTYGGMADEAFERNFGDDLYEGFDEDGVDLTV